MDNNQCKCRVSTGIDDYLTFGTGALDDWGFYEFPCSHHNEKSKTCSCIACRLKVIDEREVTLRVCHYCHEIFRGTVGTLCTGCGRAQ
jgi:hypothetical protein